MDTETSKLNLSKHENLEVKNFENLEIWCLRGSYPQVQSSQMHCSFRGILDSISGNFPSWTSSSSRESGDWSPLLGLSSGFLGLSSGRLGFPAAGLSSDFSGLFGFSALGVVSSARGTLSGLSSVRLSFSAAGDGFPVGDT